MEISGGNGDMVRSWRDRTCRTRNRYALPVRLLIDRLHHPTINSAYTDYPPSGSGFLESSAPDITAWKLARSVIEHENNLVNHRLTWFFSSQAFLLAAFFLLFSYSDKPILLALAQRHILTFVFAAIAGLGIYMCLVTKNGLDRAYEAIDHVTTHYCELKKKHLFNRTPPLHIWGPPSYADGRFVPRVTVAMWAILLAVCLLVLYRWPSTPQPSGADDSRYFIRQR